ncbi:MAG TPA: RidA family protein [Candidatus Limnocylindria bacterium]|nr:RidA family protein [Candidatus Limnocylindria bacterium]
MDRKQINPWTWQDKFGFSQAWRVDGAQSAVYVAGQGPISPEGEVIAPGDFDAQARLTFENLGTVLAQAGASFDAVVKVTAYMTDMSRLRDYARVRDEFVNTDAPPASTAIGVSSLALPGMMIEVDAIAVL